MPNETNPHSSANGCSRSKKPPCQLMRRSPSNWNGRPRNRLPNATPATSITTSPEPVSTQSHSEAQRGSWILPRKLKPTGRRISASSTSAMAKYMPENDRSEEHTSELQSLMRISYAVFRLQKKKKQIQHLKATQTIDKHRYQLSSLQL